MRAQLSAVVFGAREPRRLAEFWAGMLDRPLVSEGATVLLPGSPGQTSLSLAPAVVSRVRPNRVHLHLGSSVARPQGKIVADALRRGATPLDVGQLPEESHCVLADPEGNEFCVIEHENAFLAGCGPLGELACDGSRAVGVFWAAALGWPLVWDRDEETAIQAPEGGTKISWGGPPLAPKHQENGQFFRLRCAPATQTQELERLLGLGARLLEPAPPSTRQLHLADPDGNEFWLVGT